MTNATEMIFGAMDADKSVSVELKHDDKLPVESNTYIQVSSSWSSAAHRSFGSLRQLGRITLHKHLGSTSSTHTDSGLDGLILVHVTLSSVRS